MDTINGMEHGAVEQGEFDLNNPALLEAYAPEINPEAEYNVIVPPPPDGSNLVEVSLAEASAEKDSVYLGVIRKGKNQGQVFVIATLDGRFVREDGELGAFLERNWVNTLISEVAGTSELASLMFKLGYPFAAQMTYGQQMAHVKRVLAEPQRVWARTEWRAGWKKQDPQTGAFIYDNAGKQVYDEIRGEKRFRTKAWEAAQLYIANGLQEGETEEQVHERFQAKSHIIANPHTGEEIVARAAIRAYEQRAD